MEQEEGKKQRWSGAIPFKLIPRPAGLHPVTLPRSRSSLHFPSRDPVHLKRPISLYLPPFFSPGIPIPVYFMALPWPFSCSFSYLPQCHNQSATLGFTSGLRSHCFSQGEKKERKKKLPLFNSLPPSSLSHTLPPPLSSPACHFGEFSLFTFPVSSLTSFLSRSLSVSLFHNLLMSSSHSFILPLSHTFFVFPPLLSFFFCLPLSPL